MFKRFQSCHKITVNMMNGFYGELLHQMPLCRGVIDYGPPYMCPYCNKNIVNSWYRGYISCFYCKWLVQFNYTLSGINHIEINDRCFMNKRIWRNSLQDFTMVLNTISTEIELQRARA